MAVAIAALVAFASTGCSGDREPREFEQDPQMIEGAMRDAATAAFGEPELQSLPVATVGEVTITAGTVAVYLGLFPTLTVEQAIEDLVDIAAANALDHEVYEVAELDASIRARALQWIDTRLDGDTRISTPDPERVALLRDSPAATTIVGRPELVTASHFLFSADARAQTPEAEAAVARLLAPLLAALDARPRPLSGVDLLEAVDETIAADADLPPGVARSIDVALTFPREYSGEPNWIGLEAVVEPFAEASFATPVGEFVGPVQTEFGWHVIVVEARESADLPTEVETTRLLEERVRREQRASALQEEVGRQMARVGVLAHQANVSLLALPAEERLRREAEERTDRYR